MSQTLKRLTAKFGMERQSDSVPRPILQRRSTEYDETVSICQKERFCLEWKSDSPEVRWLSFGQTERLDGSEEYFGSRRGYSQLFCRLLQRYFYSILVFNHAIKDFSAVHNEVFKAKSKVQQEFLNTDAIYLTAYASLSLFLRGPEKINAVLAPFFSS